LPHRYAAAATRQLLASPLCQADLELIAETFDRPEPVYLAVDDSRSGTIALPTLARLSKPE
jgi:hypothetical protein